MARFASLLFLGSGILVAVVVPLAPGDATPWAQIVVAGLAFAVGVAAWRLPWDRWPRAASLALIPPALALIAVGNLVGGSSLHDYGIFFVVVFVWIGVAHPPRTSLWVAPLAVVAFAVPLFHLPGNPSDGLSAAVLTILVSVFVGESLAMGVRRLDRTEHALDRQREIAQALRRLDEMKDRIMWAASHELKTPITISRGHLEVLGPSPTPEEIRRAIELVLDELDRMGRIVDDLETLKLMEDPGALERHPTGLARFLGDVAAKARPLLGDRLRVRLADVDGATVPIDRQRLTQAVLNLLRNAAIHGSPGGPIELAVSEDPDCWRVEVTDRGGGLPSGQEEELFLPLRTGPSAAAGSGLGLSIVRAIAEAHGGSAGVENHPGLGASFWVRVPK